MATNKIDLEGKKTFMSNLHKLFDKIDNLAEEDKINSMDYNELATIVKDIYNQKREIQQTIVYISLENSVKRKTPKKPIPELEKLRDIRYDKCDYCDKLLLIKYMEDHINTTEACYRQRQSKRNVFNVKKLTNPEQYGLCQALNVVLKKRHHDVANLELSPQIMKALHIECRLGLTRVYNFI